MLSRLKRHLTEGGTKKYLVIAGSLVLVIVASVGIYWHYWGKPKSLRDQVSYSIGVQFGRSLNTQDLDLSARALSRGMSDGLTGSSLVMSDDEMQAAMARLNQERQKAQGIEAEKNKVKATDFLSDNRNRQGIKVTRSGLQYTIFSEGKGPSPTADDVVVVSYRGTLLDGKEFDNSVRRRGAAEFPVKGVIPGWSEGLQLMKKGGKAKFFIPPDLAYGDRPRQNIPPNSVLIFDVELLDVKAANTVRDRSPSVPQKSPEIIRAKAGDTKGRVPSSAKKK